MLSLDCFLSNRANLSYKIIYLKNLMMMTISFAAMPKHNDKKRHSCPNLAPRAEDEQAQADEHLVEVQDDEIVIEKVVTQPQAKKSASSGKSTPEPIKDWGSEMDRVLDGPASGKRDSPSQGAKRHSAASTEGPPEKRSPPFKAIDSSRNGKGTPSSEGYSKEQRGEKSKPPKEQRGEKNKPSKGGQEKRLSSNKGPSPVSPAPEPKPPIPGLTYAVATSPVKKPPVRRAPTQLPSLSLSGGACANPEEQEGAKTLDVTAPSNQGPLPNLAEVLATLPTPVCVPANVVGHITKLQQNMDEMLHLQGIVLSHQTKMVEGLAQAFKEVINKENEILDLLKALKEGKEEPEPESDSIWEVFKNLAKKK